MVFKPGVRPRTLRVVGTGFSFEVVDAHDYDDLRPRYAEQAVAWVARRAGLRPRSLVVDLAAGTGQLSGAFADLSMRVVAVEPGSNMRAVLADRVPGVRVMDGTAEAIPLGDAEADLVVVGNAFHHFDAARALAEIRRILRHGAGLALFWARGGRDELRRYPLKRAIDESVDRLVQGSPIVAAYERYRDDVPGTADGFTPFERREFEAIHVLPSARLADLYATSSDVASLPEHSRMALLDRIRGLARGLPELLELPARSQVDLCFRSAADRRLDADGSAP
jgi:SAM-dependent methyltransferase